MSEQALVDGLRERREEDVQTFLERYRPLLHHCIAQFETDPTSREDLYQDLVCFVLERLDRDTFDPSRGSFGTWLYRVGWCRCVDLKRRQSTRARLVESSEEEPLAETPCAEPSPELRAGDSEIGGLVRAAMEELAPEERALLRLRYVEGRTLGELAEELGLSLETAKYRLRRSTRSLRRQILARAAPSEILE